MTYSLSYVEVDGSAAVANIKMFRSLIRQGVELAGVIKGNAYGHGLVEMASVVDPLVDYFQLDDVAELKKLRRVSRKPALVLGYVAPDELAEAVRLNGIVTVFDEERLWRLDRLGQRDDRAIPVEVEVDAYLGRQGLLVDQLVDFLHLLRGLPGVKLHGLYAHFADSSDPLSRHVAVQVRAFDQAWQVVEALGFSGVRRHISATSGILVHEREGTTNDVVRLGAGMYGLWPSPELRQAFSDSVSLRPVMRWVTRVAQLKVIPEGYPVGYGLTFVAPRAMRLALLPVGYSDGYDRGLSNRGQVLIGGQRCAVVGRVSMNMMVVDASQVPSARVGDEVVLLGRQDTEEVTADELARLTDTINYEVTTRISPLLPRKIV